MRASLATQKPLFQTSLLLSIDCIFVQRSYLSFFANYFFSVIFSVTPPGGGRNKKTPSHFYGLAGGVSAVTHLLFRAASV